MGEQNSARERGPGRPEIPPAEARSPAHQCPRGSPGGDARAPPAAAFPSTAGPGGWQDGPPLGKSSAAAAAGGPQTPRDSAPPRRGPGPGWAPAPSTLTLPPLWASEGPDPGGPGPRSLSPVLFAESPSGARLPSLGSRPHSPDLRDSLTPLPPRTRVRGDSTHPRPSRGGLGQPRPPPPLRINWARLTSFGNDCAWCGFGVGHVCTEAHGSHSCWDWEGKSHLADGSRTIYGSRNFLNHLCTSLTPPSQKWSLLYSCWGSNGFKSLRKTFFEKGI
nr:basic proline-rich protein-like [Vicugna pacos]